MTSFYQGNVVKLTIFTVGQPNSYWEIVDILDIDTDSDDNIHIDFSHGHTARAVFVPASIIKDFNPDSTKLVKRIFDTDAILERWEAVE